MRHQQQNKIYKFIKTNRMFYICLYICEMRYIESEQHITAKWRQTKLHVWNALAVHIHNIYTLSYLYLCHLSNIGRNFKHSITNVKCIFSLSSTAKEQNTFFFNEKAILINIDSTLKEFQIFSIRSKIAKTKIFPAFCRRNKEKKKIPYGRQFPVILSTVFRWIFSIQIFNYYFDQ